MEFDTLANTVGPDALEAVFARSSDGNTLKVTLLYEGCQIVVTADFVCIDENPDKQSADGGQADWTRLYGRI